MAPFDRLLLASRSPRRASLLKEAGVVFDQTDPPFDDPAQPVLLPDQTPADLAEQLAIAKAGSVPMLALAPDPVRVLILACDTLVVATDGSLLGQPTDREQARLMLEKILGQTHRVITGVALGHWDAQGDFDGTSFTDAARVRLGTVAAERLEAYLDREAWRGKAGAYNLAELGDWPFEIKGDPTCVVGLPMRKLMPLLESHGVQHAWRDSAHPLGRNPSS